MIRPVTSVFLLVAITVSCTADSGSDTGKNEAMETESGFADVPGGQIFYEAAGSGEAVVFIHGNVGDRRHWDSQFLALAANYRVIRFDMRGYGRSSLPVEGEPYSGHDDLAILLNHLGVESAHVVGWSMGSGIAFDFALAYPENTSSVVSTGPWVHGYSSPAVRSMGADLGPIRAAAAAGDQPAAVDAWMSAPFWATSITDPAAAERFRQIAADHSFWAFGHNSPQQPLVSRAVGRTREVRAPTLIVTAEYDIPACREIAELLDETVPDSSKVDIKGTGHLLHMERSEEFNQLLLEFFRLQSTNE